MQVEGNGPGRILRIVAREHLEFGQSSQGKNAGRADLVRGARGNRKCPKSRESWAAAVMVRAVASNRRPGLGETDDVRIGRKARGSPAPGSINPV